MRRHDEKDKFSVTIELTDFSGYYPQGAAEAAIAAMKEGKSEVMCEQGQPCKVSKAKDGLLRKIASPSIGRTGWTIGPSISIS